MNDKYKGKQLLIQTFTWLNPAGNKKPLKQSMKIIDGKLFITGRIQFANKLNGNERYYPRPVLQKAIQDFQVKIKRRLAYCEMDHPDSDIISVERITALITQIHWEGDEVIGTLQVLSNRRGEDIRRVLIEDQGSISISSRGLGSLLRTQKGDQVQDDYQITTWDLVIDPSTPYATFWSPKAIKQSLEEKVQKLIQNKPIVEKKKNVYIEQIQNIFNKHLNKNLK